MGKNKRYETVAGTVWDISDTGNPRMLNTTEFEAGAVRARAASRCRSLWLWLLNTGLTLEDGQ
jgi:hypothetical protein